jgi:hypothetical protein
MARAVARYAIVADDSQATGALRRVQRGFRDTAVVARRLGLGLGAVATAAAAVTSQSIRMQGELGKQSRELGVSTELLSEMRGVLDLIGVEQSSFTRALALVNRQFLALERGTETAEEAFGRLGLTLEDLQGLSTEDRLTAVVGALENMTDETERVAVAQELFRGSFSAVLRLADTGTSTLARMRQEQRDLGRSISADQAQAAEEAEDAWTRLQQTIGAVRDEIAGDAAPAIADALNGVADAMQAFLDRGSELRADTPGSVAGARAREFLADPQNQRTALNTVAGGIAGGAVAQQMLQLLREQLTEAQATRVAAEESARWQGSFGNTAGFS